VSLYDRIPVRRHRIAQLDVYEISVEELEHLERAALRGSEAFGFMVFGLSVGISFTVTLLTVDIKSDRVFESFLLVTILAFVVGVFFAIRWLIERSASVAVAQRIRSRVGLIGDDEAGLEAVDGTTALERPPSEGR
jgi:hypothetical protein